MHKQEKAFAKISVTNTYVQKIHKRRVPLLKQSTWQLTLEQIKPLAGMISHVLIQRKKVTCGDFQFEH